MGKPGVAVPRRSYRSPTGAPPCGVVRLGMRAGAGWRHEPSPCRDDHHIATAFRPEAGVHVCLRPDGALAALRADFFADRFARAVRHRGFPDFPPAQFLEAVAHLAHRCRPLLRGPESGVYLRPDLMVEGGHDHWVFRLRAYLLPSAFGMGFLPLHLRWDPGARGGLHLCWVDSVGRRLVLAPTPADDVSALARASVTALAPRWGLRVSERSLSAAQWYRLSRQGRVVEAFVCGGPALVQPVGRIGLGDVSWPVGDGQPGPTVISARRHLFRLQRGQTADPDHWTLLLR
ncbi:hypothetical protein [Streptomyces sp. NPDC049915]|uniref:hypothetical protein n=1 Tax=Streptomyces sp. NPDC049915 TaxID=3155510 RepID=UPI003422FB7B